MRNVYLEGELGEKYGKKLRIRADTIEQVFKCLDGNFVDFRGYLMECHNNDIGFTFHIGQAGLTSEKELFLRFKEGDMIITPQPMGAKSGFGKFLTVVAAIVLIAATAGAGAAAAGPAAAGGGAAGGTAAGGTAAGAAGGTAAGGTAAGGTTAAAGGFGASAAKGLGIALMSIGIQKLLMPDPATDTQQDSSYLFQGSSHNMVEGDPVPVLYGELRIPGRPVSAVARNAAGYFYNGIIHEVSPPSEGGTVNPGESCGGGGSTTPGTDPTDPQANPDTYSCEYEQTITGNVLDNDTHSGVKGTDWGVVDFTAPAYGTLNWVTNNQATFAGGFTYTATTLGAEGKKSDTFSYSIKDNSTGAIAASEVTITYVEDSQGAISLASDVYFTPLNTQLTGNVLDNDTHSVSGVTLTITGNTQPSHGSLSIGNNGSFTYTPNNNFNGEDFFTYTVEDSRGGSETSPQVIITVGSGEPIATPDQYETSLNTNLEGNVLTNDSHTQQGIDFSVNTSTIVGPSNGTLNISTNGSFTYTPNNNFSGQDTFNYTIVDDNNKSASAAVVIDVLSGSPTATNDSFIVPHNTAITKNVLSNDLPATPGSTIVVFGDAADPTNNGPFKGTILNGDISNEGVFTYTPNTGESGQDTFKYVVADTVQNTTDVGTVTLTILSAGPVATDDTYSVQHNTALTVTDLLANDSSPGSLSFTVTSNTTPTNGALTSGVSSAGEFTYTPTTDYSGSDQFTYTITDSAGQSTSATVYLSISEAPNQTPVATTNYINNQTFNTTVTGNVRTFITDADAGDIITVLSVHEAPTKGTLTIDLTSSPTTASHGSWQYTPNEGGFEGTDTFEVFAVDDNTPTAAGVIARTVITYNAEADSGSPTGPGEHNDDNDNTSPIDYPGPDDSEGFTGGT